MHIVQSPPAPRTTPGGRMKLHCIPAATDNLVWGLECLETGTFAVVDGPGAMEVEVYETETELNTTVVLTTHTHGDHIGIHRAWQVTGRLQAMQVIGRGDVPGVTQIVDDGDVIRIGAVDGIVMRTNGHLNGHLSYVIDGALLCGDTLFSGGCGYLFDGPPVAMFNSLMRLAGLPGGTLVCCAHEYTEDNLRFAVSVESDNKALLERQAWVQAERGAGRCTLPSTIEIERATNPFLRTGSPSLRETVACDNTQRQVFAAARTLKDSGLYKR